MKIKLYCLLISAILLISAAPVTAFNGELDFGVGYVYIDDEGNQSMSQPTFNFYEGLGVSAENINLLFNNGIMIRSSLRNVNLDNRNLYFNISKPGLFGAKVRSSQFRRIYSFDGDNRTKRDLTQADIWLKPIRHVKFFAEGDFNYLSGQTESIYETSFENIARSVDYEKNKYTIGGLVKHDSRMFRAEYASSDYTDNERSMNNQTRKLVRLIAMAPAPKYEWLILTGSFQRFTNEYDDTGLELESTTFKGGILAKLPNNFSANYIAYFNRAGSDSDFVETDNLSHSIYIKYLHSSTLGGVIGYQNHVNDDYEDIVKSNSFFVKGWVSPIDKLELKATYGFRAEEVDEGDRLLGDEDRNRFKFSAEYRFGIKSSIKGQFENKSRENEQRGVENDFMRFTFSGVHDWVDYAVLSASYSFADGDYANPEQTFKYTNHQVHAGVNSHRYKNLSAGLMVIYYKSGEDLDTEGSDLRLTSQYSFMNENRIELIYNIFNFDDFLFRDHYYTANIVEIKIIKSFNF